MKILEIMGEFLSTTKIFEIAFERKQAKNAVTSLSPLIFEHLLKLFVFKDTSSINHWCNELDNCFDNIDKIYDKPSNKKLSKYDIYNWLVLDAAPHYTTEYVDKWIIKLSKTKYQGIQVNDYDSDWVLNKILAIIDKVSDDISNDNFITIKDYIGD